MPNKVKKKNQSEIKISKMSAKWNDGGEETSEPLTLIDVTCPVCLSIMIKPVTMPCLHSLCLECFEASISESNLACPLCRKRISVWVRRKHKTNDLTNEIFWKKIQEHFKEEVEARLTNKEDLNNTFTSTLPPRIVSAPGEIKEEYEDELRRVREEEKRKKEEEETASKLVAEKLQEEERKRHEQAQRELEMLSSGDLEFAKQLRSSQLKETLKNLRNSEGKTQQGQNQLSASLKTSPVGPMDIYLGQGTPSTSRETSRFIGSPLTSTPVPRKATKRKLCDEGNAIHSRFFRSKGDESPAASSRPLKDITSHYHSGSESEFDSEENICNSKMEAKRRCQKSHRSVKEDESLSSISDEIKSLEAFQDENNEFSDGPRLDTLLKLFDENIQVDQESVKKLVEEQKALEDRLQQEKRDRILALQLQKELKKVDRTKGSADEYCLRQSLGKGRVEGSGTPSMSPVTPNSHKKRSRQLTLLESLTKKQPRL